MYVCLCNGFTDRCVRNAISDGAGSVSKVYKSLGATPQCGKCKDTIRELLTEDRPTPMQVLASSPA